MDDPELPHTAAPGIAAERDQAQFPSRWPHGPRVLRAKYTLEMDDSLIPDVTAYLAELASRPVYAPRGPELIKEPARRPRGTACSLRAMLEADHAAEVAAKEAQLCTRRQARKRKSPAGLHPSGRPSKRTPTPPLPPRASPGCSADEAELAPPGNDPAHAHEQDRIGIRPWGDQPLRKGKRCKTRTQRTELHPIWCLEDDDPVDSLPAPSCLPIPTPASTDSAGDSPHFSSSQTPQAIDAAAMLAADDTSRGPDVSAEIAEMAFADRGTPGKSLLARCSITGRPGVHLAGEQHTAIF